MRLFSLKWLLFGSYIFFGFLPIVGISYLTTTNASQFVSSITQEQLEERSRLLAMQMNDRIYRQHRELLLLARFSAGSDHQLANIESYLQQMPAARLFTFHQTIWHKGNAPLEEESGLELKKTDASYNLHFYTNLPGQQGYIERIISLAYILAPLYSSMGDDIATYFLQSPDGEILWQSTGVNALTPKNQQPVKEANYPVSRLGVLLHIQIPEKFLFQDINDQERKNLLIVLLVSILATITAFMASSIFSHKLKHIVNGTSQLAQGNFDYRIPEQRLHEMILLAEMVNAMGEQLKSHKEKVIQAEKLSSLGMFSVEVAHELKNPLAGMKASAQLLTSMAQKMDVQIDNILKDRAEVAGGIVDVSGTGALDALQKRLYQAKSIAKGIDSETDRLTEILQELLIFAKPSPPKKRDVAVAFMVESAIKALYAQIKKQDITIAVSLDQAFTHVDPIQILQVLINLLTNAVSAVLKKNKTPAANREMAAIPQGSESNEYEWPPKTNLLQSHDRQYAIYGSTSVAGNRSDVSIWITGLCDKDDDYLLIIKDKGIGIAQEHLERIFDPFFSFGSKGHGLGLSIVQSLCRQNNIALDVQSELGQGTTFNLHLNQPE